MDTNENNLGKLIGKTVLKVFLPTEDDQSFVVLFTDQTRLTVGIDLWSDLLGYGYDG